MSEFKVGDRVRKIRNAVGRVGTVVRVEVKDHKWSLIHYVTDMGTAHNDYSDAFELVTPLDGLQELLDAVESGSVHTRAGVPGRYVIYHEGGDIVIRLFGKGKKDGAS